MKRLREFLAALPRPQEPCGLCTFDFPLKILANGLKIRFTGNAPSKIPVNASIFKRTETRTSEVSVQKFEHGSESSRAPIITSKNQQMRFSCVNFERIVL